MPALRLRTHAPTRPLKRTTLRPRPCSLVLTSAAMGKSEVSNRVDERVNKEQSATMSFSSLSSSPSSSSSPLFSRRATLTSFAAGALVAATITPLPPLVPLPLPLPLLQPLPALAFLSSTRKVLPVTIAPALRPDPLSYDAADPRLREAANALQLALNAESLEREDAAWTAVIERYEPLIEVTRMREKRDRGNATGNNKNSNDGDDAGRYSETSPAPWAEEIVSRAYGNRGNARARAGKADAALADLERSIELAPWASDPVLNRGVVLENSGRLEEAARDYRAVIEATGGKDASPFNNLGNVALLEAARLESAGKGPEGGGASSSSAAAARAKYREAAESFGKAVALAPSFSFAAANRAVALFAACDDDAAALKELRRLTRRFPNFDEARAAAAGILWARGDRAEAEGEWSRVDDVRYGDVRWLVEERHWPPRLVEAASALLEVRAVR